MFLFASFLPYCVPFSLSFPFEGGVGSFRSDFASLSFPGAIRGSNLVLLATKANLCWEGGSQATRSFAALLAVFADFHGEFFWQLWLPKVT